MALTPVYLPPVQNKWDAAAPQFPTASADNPVPVGYTGAGTPTAVNTTVTNNIPDPNFTAPPVTPAGTGAGTPHAVNAYVASIGNPVLLPAWSSGTTYALNAVVGYIASDSSTRVAAAYASGTTYAISVQVVATDGNLYTSLHAGNVGNTPQSSPLNWALSATSFNPASNYATHQQVLLDNVLYVCVSAVTSNEPDQDSTDWGSGVSITGAWVVGTTYAASNVVTYLNDYYISLVGSNTGNTPGVVASEGFWAKIFAPAWESKGSYPVGAYVTFLGVLYLAVNATVSNNPRMSNDLLNTNHGAGGDQPVTVLWDTLGYGLQAPYISLISSNLNHQPDTATADWALTRAFNSDITREGAVTFPPLSYPAGSESDVWHTSNYFTGGSGDSVLTRQDFSSIISTIAVSPSAPSFAHTTTQQLTVTVKDAAGNTLNPGHQPGVPLVTFNSATTAKMTVDANGLLTGVAAGTSVITITCGNKSITITATAT